MDILHKLLSANSLKHFSMHEKKILLEMYYIITKKESLLCNLVYAYHDCDSYESLFRDFDEYILEDKSNGIDIALKKIKQKLRICINCNKNFKPYKHWHTRCKSCARNLHYYPN